MTPEETTEYRRQQEESEAKEHVPNTMSSDFEDEVLYKSFKCEDEFEKKSESSTHLQEGAHSKFVTGVEVLPYSPTWGETKAAALSISEDNRGCIHSLPIRRKLPPWLVIIIIIVLLFFAFILFSYFGL